jgi:hypothetical protein
VPNGDRHGQIADAAKQQPTPVQDASWTSSVPPEVQTRLKSMAKRKGLAPVQIAGLFDFSVDPFTFAPLNVEGSGTSDRSRKVALLVAARSFLATGKWQGDWAEIKAMCTHQNCYDLANFAKVLKNAKGDIFKVVEPGTSVELSAAGTEQAEQLVAALAGPANVAAE